ncbi:MAG: DinB family protein [Verrucomicrobiales bacterium]|nr:DinB family protein [Verrucomicrobiales bacterium]
MKEDTFGETSQPQLDRPGAGLPAIELFIAKRIVAAKYRKMSRDEVIADFERERVLISGIASRVAPEIGSKRVLVKRQRGMEDSSRFWSIYMVLDHLRIVNEAVSSFIGLLGEGKCPHDQADTAKVKPAAGVGPEVIDVFNATCRDLAGVVASIDRLDTRVKHPHPWFGPFDAGQWHHMAAFHMTLHRKQIEAILRELS